MGYEVDFVGVGAQSKSGDAIALRWGNLSGGRHEQRVVIIDGGFKESGGDVVDHVKQHFATDWVDAVVSTHPDQDHVNGLHVVLEGLGIKELWIHKPWEHNTGLAEQFVDGWVPDNSPGVLLQESLNSANDLVAKAEKLGIRIVEPFTGTSLYNQGEFRIFGPSRDYYQRLISDFDGMPESGRTEMSRVIRSRVLFEEAVATVKRVIAKWGVDKLDNEDTTTAKNNSSVISGLAFDGRLLLFTADAGITALSRAADEIKTSLPAVKLRLMQIPHHGSKRNVGPEVLDKLVGPPVVEGQTRGILAVASTAKFGEPKHPSKAVMNAFTHRGAGAYATRGKTLCARFGTEARRGWGPAEPEQYHRSYQEKG